MNVLVLALYAEGSADERFLPIIIQRAAQDLLLREGRQVTDVLSPFLVKPLVQSRGHAEALLAVARQCAGYHALVIHADADADSATSARRNRIQPGCDLIASAHAAGESVCNVHIPLVPIHMTEAWMLADADALRVVLGTSLTNQQLGLPNRAHELEREANPKHTLTQAISYALASRPQRRRRVERADLDEPLARQIRLHQLESLSSYREFVTDLRKTLQRLHFIATP